MNEKVLDTARLDAEKNEQNLKYDSTMEMNAVKKVVRESWESKLKEKGANLDILGKHAEFMTKEFGSIGYETMCMQNIVAHAKHMSKSELIAYMQIAEALAVGYKSKFGLNFGGLLIAGVTLVSKDLNTMRKHFNYFMSHLSQNSDVLGRRLDKEISRMMVLNSELNKKERGLLRFLRKKEIYSLKVRIRAKQKKIVRLKTKRDRCVSTVNSLKTKAAVPPKPNQ